jgi:hypothetical protein
MKMCVPRDQRGGALLRLLAAIALFLAISLPSLAHPSAGTEKNWFDAARGLLFGLSIGLNLFGFRRALGRPSRAEPKL